MELKNVKKSMCSLVLRRGFEAVEQTWYNNCIGYNNCIVDNYIIDLVCKIVYVSST